MHLTMVQSKIKNAKSNVGLIIKIHTKVNHYIYIHLSVLRVVGFHIVSSTSKIFIGFVKYQTLNLHKKYTVAY